MGTRNLTAVQLDGQYKIAQYGQWDGYPSGQGATILAFLSKWDRPLFESKLRAASFYSDEEVDALWRQGGADEQGRISMEKAAIVKAQVPPLSRDLGASILQYVQDAPAGTRLVNHIDFAGDSLFCEWAYVLDLDTGVLEVYKGFNTEPLGESARFAKAPGDADSEYHPIGRVASYSLDALPTVEQMEADCGE